MIFKRCLLALVVMGLTFLFTSTAYPARQSEIESLRGLTGVEVIVEHFDDKFKRELPFDENQIKVDVELKLRMAGIKVFSREESSAVSGNPYLYVILNGGFEPTTELFYYVIRIELCQDVILKRQSASLATGTWDTSYTGITSKSIALRIRDTFKVPLDVFISDYLSVNPKGGK